MQVGIGEQKKDVKVEAPCKQFLAASKVTKEGKGRRVAFFILSLLVVDSSVRHLSSPCLIHQDIGRSVKPRIYTD